MDKFPSSNKFPSFQANANVLDPPSSPSVPTIQSSMLSLFLNSNSVFSFCQSPASPFHCRTDSRDAYSADRRTYAEIWLKPLFMPISPTNYLSRFVVARVVGWICPEWPNQPRRKERGLATLIHQNGKDGKS